MLAQVQYREEYKSFTHFLTSVCAIVGGVFTVSGLIDSFIYHGQKVCFKILPWRLMLVCVLNCPLMFLLYHWTQIVAVHSCECTYILSLCCLTQRGEFLQAIKKKVDLGKQI